MKNLIFIVAITMFSLNAAFAASVSFMTQSIYPSVITSMKDIGIIDVVQYKVSVTCQDCGLINVVVSTSNGTLIESRKMTAQSPAWDLVYLPTGSYVVTGYSIGHLPYSKIIKIR